MPFTSRRDALRLLAAGGVAGVAGCSSFGGGSGPNEDPPASLGTSWSPPEDAWPFRFRDLQNTAQSPHGVGSQPSVEWTDGADGDPSSTEEHGDLVAATASRVFAAREFDGSVSLRALAADDGAQQWDRSIESPSDHPTPRYGGLVDGTLYVTDLRSDVVAVDAADGAVRWRRNLYEHVAESVPERFLSPNDSPDDFAAVPLATPETVFVQTPYGVHGLAPSDGTEQWRLHLAAEDSESPLARPFGLAVTDSGVWASYGRPEPLLFAVEVTDDGPDVERTRLPFRDYPHTPVAISDRKAVLTNGAAWSSKAQETLAVGTTTDEAEWQFPGYAGEGAAAYAPLATDGELAFVCEASERPARLVVAALRTDTGKLEWTHRESLADRDVTVADGQTFRLCQPAVAGESVVVGFGQQPDGASGRGAVLALSRDAGRLRWRADLPVAPEDVMVTSDRLYVGGRQGGVVALAGESGG